MTRREEFHKAYEEIERAYSVKLPEFVTATCALLDLTVSYDKPSGHLYISRNTYGGKIYRFNVLPASLEQVTDAQWAALLGRVKDGSIQSGQSFDAASTSSFNL